MELNTPSPSSQIPDSDLSKQPPPAQPLSDMSSTLPPRTSTPIPKTTVFRHLKSYPFHSDLSYQSGLSSILGHPSTPATQSELSENSDLVIQAQCFYFARKFNLDPIDVTEYKAFLSTKHSPSPQPTPPPQPQQTGNESTNNPLSRPDPIERPSAPTPLTASTASTLSVQPNSQDITHPPVISDTKSSGSTTIPTAEADGPSPPYPTSFADIVDLITQNKPIPGIETIPDTVLEPGSSKQDRTTRRRKPWEKDEVLSATQDENVDLTAALKNSTEPAPVDVTTRTTTGEGVVHVLQPGAIPDSGLLSEE